MSDLQNLMFWIHSEVLGCSPRWVVVRCKPLIERSVLILVPYLDKETMQSSKRLPFISAMRERAPPVSMRSVESGDGVKELLMSHKKRDKNSPPPQEKLVAVSEYILTESDQRHAEYPQDNKVLEPKGLACVVAQQEHKHPLEADQDFPLLVAIDCEMVGTDSGSSLARISAVDVNLNVLVDEFVLPDEEITDYRTPFSGISEATLKNVTTTLKDVHKVLKKALPENAILIGHSLENDLNSLKLTYARCIDTQQLYPHPSVGYRSSLSHLVQTHLHELMERQGGHCSVEDARCTMRLALLKLARGPTYGCPKIDRVPFSELLPVTLFDSEQTLVSSRIPCDRQICEDDDGVGAGVVERLEGECSTVTIVVLRGYQKACLAGKGKKAALKEIDQQVQRITGAMKTNDFGAIFSTSGDRELLDLTEGADAERAKHCIEDAGGMFFVKDEKVSKALASINKEAA